MDGLSPNLRWNDTFLNTACFSFEAAVILNFTTRPQKLSLFLSNFPPQPFVAAYIYYHNTSRPVNKINTLFLIFLTLFLVAQNLVFFVFCQYKTLHFCQNPAKKYFLKRHLFLLSNSTLTRIFVFYTHTPHFINITKKASEFNSLAKNCIN